jgi:tetratricopeptide (TPR) repeat protein
MISTKRLLASAGVALLAGLAAPLLIGGATLAPALAMGGNSSSSSSSTSTTSDTAAKSSTSDDYIEAQRKVQASDYNGAIPILEGIVKQEPGNADALNYLGYSHRKLGNTTKALAYYLKALANEPEHLGANEYLGELYLEMGALPKAEERLAILQKACSGCMEEAELAEKIAAFKAVQG